jgi:hypothetical protein
LDRLGQYVAVVSITICTRIQCFNAFAELLTSTSQPPAELARPKNQFLT